jgi:hypothetical protein
MKNNNGENKMKIKNIVGTGSYDVLINGVVAYEIYNGSRDVGYTYWQVTKMYEHAPYREVINALDSFKDAKQFVKEQEGIA